ncbi:MAG: amidohydrolase [Bacteroidia bacterium]|nr:amidohydrolase [Bacteroidia bacterium]
MTKYKRELLPSFRMLKPSSPTPKELSRFDFLSFGNWNLFGFCFLLFGILTSITMLSTTSCSRSSARPAADLIVINGSILADASDMTRFEAMAVKGDTILKLGTSREIGKYQDKHTRVIDAGGKMVLPGFIDSHVHFLLGGIGLSSVILKDAKTKEEFISRIRDFTKTVKPGEWILEGNWDHQNWGGELPAREWIDQYTSDNPVFISRSDGHMALANTAALKAAGVGRNVKEIDGGYIGRTAGGDLTGIFRDNAMALISNHVPDYTADQYDRALDAAMKYVSANGVTSVDHMGTIGDIGVFQRALEGGKLITRIYATAPIPSWKMILEKIRETSGDDRWLKCGGAKIFADGSLGSHTAAFTEPYTDDPATKGLLMDDETNMLNQILTADSAGLQVVVHAIGDRANHLVMNFYEETIRRHGQRDRRFRIEHAQHLLPSDIPRFKELGVIPSMQPWHLTDDGRWAENSIGPERIKTTYCFRSLLDAGATLAFGSDWYVAPPVPLEGIQAAVTRQTLDGAYPDGWVPAEKISVQEALVAYTINAAYASFDENRKGTLEPGKLADFVILDRDILSIPPETIKDTKVVMTVIGGKTVFQRK